MLAMQALLVLARRESENGDENMGLATDQIVGIGGQYTRGRCGENPRRILGKHGLPITNPPSATNPFPAGQTL